jgi:hypothetical protein
VDSYRLLSTTAAPGTKEHTKQRPVCSDTVVMRARNASGRSPRSAIGPSCVNTHDNFFDAKDRDVVDLGSILSEFLQHESPATPKRLHCAKPPTNNDVPLSTAIILLEKPTKVERTTVKLAALSFNKPRAVIDSSRVSEVLLAAACRRRQIETPMLRHRILCAPLGHGVVRIIGV